MHRLTARLKDSSAPLVRSIWRGVIPQCRTMHDVVVEVSEATRISVRAILGYDCERDVTAARHEAFRIISEELRADSTEIAYFFGNRDPSAVRHALRKRRLSVERVAAE